MVICHLCHLETASLMTRRDQYGHLLPLSKTGRLSTETTLVSPFLHPETIKFDGTQRHFMIIRTFVIQRQSSPIARRDNSWSFTTFDIQRLASTLTRKDQYGQMHPFVEDSTSIDRDYFSLPSSSRDNQVRWHAETNHGHPHPFHHPETIKSDGTWRHFMVICTFVIQRQSSPITHGDNSWSFATFVIQRQASLLTCSSIWSSTPFRRRLNVYRSRLI